MILLSSSRSKISTAQKYVNEISQADDLPAEEIEKNRERNGDLVLDNVWSVEQLFMFFKYKLNCPTIVTRTGFSIERGLKKNKLYSEYFKECTFRPQITKKAHEVQKQKEVMSKIDQNLNVFDPERHELESMNVSDKNSINNGSAKKSTFKRHSRSFHK